MDNLPKSAMFDCKCRGPSRRVPLEEQGILVSAGKGESTVYFDMRCFECVCAQIRKKDQELEDKYGYNGLLDVLSTEIKECKERSEKARPYHHKEMMEKVSLEERHKKLKAERDAARDVYREPIVKTWGKLED